MQTVTLETFTPFVGEAFQLPTGTGDRIPIVLHSAAPIRLAEVDPRRTSRVPGVRAEPFALLFVASSDVTIPQGLYRLIDPAGVEHALLLVPVGPGAGGLQYESIFN